MFGSVPPETSLSRREWVRALAMVCLLGVLFFYGLGAVELWRTENLRAIIAAEFLRSGNWVVPTLYGEPLFTKPPGCYAAIAAVSWPFGGVSDATARLPSALAAAVTALLFYAHFARRLGRTAGLVALGMLPCSLLWLDKVPSAEIDFLQIAWVSAALLCFFRALEGEESLAGRSAWAWWTAALLCVAGGVLTKWTGAVFFYATAVPLLYFRGRLRLLLGRRHLLAATLAACVCLAWVGLAVHQAGWDTFWRTVSQEGLQRLSPAHNREARAVMDPGHEPGVYPFGETLLHPFKVWATALPGSLFALVALWPGFAGIWDERGRRLLMEMHCWLWPSLLFWSVVPEHAVRHSGPLFPAIAGLAALAWVAWLEGRLRWPVAWATPGRALVGVLACWLVVKLVFVHGVLPARNPNRQPRAKGEQIAAAVPAGQTLYLFRLKDEGIMFYYGRARGAHAYGADAPVLRLGSPEELPSRREPVYCILAEHEWRVWKSPRPAEAVLYLRDEQGDPIVLVRVSAPGPRATEAAAGEETAERGTQP
jgi:4-amino-4-deoxy-L-arabinose transferase-like glycosyltransferase